MEHSFSPISIEIVFGVKTAQYSSKVEQHLSRLLRVLEPI